MRARILVAADDPTVRDILTSALPRQWRAASAAGPAEALAALEAALPDVLLIALRSETDAYDLARAARLAGPCLVILVFVPSASFAGLGRALDAHVDGVFALPLSAEEIPLVLEAHIGLGRGKRRTGRAR